MIYQFDLPWNFEQFQKQIQKNIEKHSWTAWPNEPWYSQINLISNNANGDMLLEPAIDLEFYLKCWKLPLLKARISKTESLGIWPSDRGWHRDEPMNEGVRIFIPVFDSDDSGIEMEDMPPQATPLGFGYTWNTSKMHRIWCKPGVKMRRIAVVIALKPNKNRNARQWAQYFQSLSHENEHTDSQFSFDQKDQ